MGREGSLPARSRTREAFVLHREGRVGVVVVGGWRRLKPGKEMFENCKFVVLV